MSLLKTVRRCSEVKKGVKQTGYTLGFGHNCQPAPRVGVRDVHIVDHGIPIPEAETRLMINVVNVAHLKAQGGASLPVLTLTCCLSGGDRNRDDGNSLVTECQNGNLMP